MPVGDPQNAIPQSGDVRHSVDIMNELTAQGNSIGSKRKRTAHACHSCRQRKSRCNGARPSCDVCLEMGFECRYQAVGLSSNRTLPVDHISHLEARLHDMEEMLQTAMAGNLQSDPISSNWQVYDEPRNLASRNEVSNGGTRAIDSQKNTSSLDSNSYISKIARDSVDGMASITFADENASGYFGLTSNSAFLSHITNALKDLTENNLPTWSMYSTTAVETDAISRPGSPLSTTVTVLRSPTPETAVDPFILPPQQEILRHVNVFFANTGLLFPYIDRTTLLGNLKKIQASSLQIAEKSQLCTLNMVMAFALVYCPSGDPVDEKVAQADVFLQRALAFLPDFGKRAANFESIQALIMVVQYVQGTQRAAQTWSLLGVVIQAAFQFGLYRRTYSEKLSALEAEVHKRVWWMCFMMDRMCSMTCGRPPLIPNSYMSVDLPLDIDLEMLEDPAWTPRNSANAIPSTSSLFLHTSKLNIILGSVIEEVYERNINDISTLPVSELLQKILQIEQCLDSWKQELPETYNLLSTSNLDEVTQREFCKSDRFKVVLSLRYLNTRALLHRIVVVRMLDHPATKDSENSIDILCTFGSSSLNICVECAIESINIISRMAQSQSLLPVWWWSIYFTFSSTLLAFGTIVVLRKHKLQLRSYTVSDLMISMQTAYKALKDLGGATRLVVRCQKIVQKLIHTAISIMQSENANSHFDLSAKPVVSSCIGLNTPEINSSRDPYSQDKLLAVIDDELLWPFDVDFSFGIPSMEDDLRLVFEHGF